MIDFKWKNNSKCLKWACISSAFFPDVIDIVKESPLVLVNVDEFVDFPRTTFFHTVYIGGLGLDASGPKTLSEPFKLFPHVMII